MDIAKQILKNIKKQNAINNLMCRLFGIKGIFYCVNDGNVKVEIGLDKNPNNDW